MNYKSSMINVKSLIIKYLFTYYFIQTTQNIVKT